VGKECTNEQVTVAFDKWSVELRLKGYRGHNHIFSIKKLFAEIVPAESKFLLKNNTLTLVIIKKDNKSWSQLAFKEEKIGAKSEKAEEKEDPQAGIMNMMKKMYE
jgi:calcyclin binding protein